MEQILNRTPVLSYTNKSNIYKITFNELSQIQNNIHIPEIQSDCNVDKIQEMKECYLDNPHFMASKSLITIAMIKIVDKQEFCLIDGQHRFQMILELVKEKKINDSMLVGVIEINSQDEMKKLFNEINADSSKCIYKDLTIFDKENYELLKLAIIKKMPDAPQKSHYKSNVYSVSQFVSMLIDFNLTDMLREKFKKNLDIKELFAFLLKKEADFFNSCQYLEMLHDNNKFKVDEKEQINKKRCMFLKKNNFVEWLINPDLEPTHDFNERPYITKKLRMETWDKYYKNLNNGKCLVLGCNTQIEKDKEYSWHCGHIISHFNGGPTELKNLKPICPSCNWKMNYKNWDDYENELTKKIILKEYFSIKDKISCKSGTCKIKITKTSFNSLKIGDKIKPVCNNCL